jgi:hypothetical protein
MTTKTRKSRKSAQPKSRKSAQPTYSDKLAECIRPSRLITSLDKSVTKLIDSNDSIIALWSFAGEHHDIAVGQRVLLRCKHMPDGTVFYNLQ